jgi:hypothetical protein
MSMISLKVSGDLFFCTFDGVPRSVIAEGCARLELGRGPESVPSPTLAIVNLRTPFRTDWAAKRGVAPGRHSTHRFNSNSDTAKKVLCAPGLLALIPSGALPPGS